ncbi:lipase family protein [Microbulbifer sp. SAOS-129_SWC]|uniref:lipase family protein n=1 Tax=Microbulbifer sp. SAOS-129_SWC TaxID=3145235 RepID=UPI0032173470
MQQVNFQQVNWYAARAAAAYQSEADIRKSYPDTALVSTSGGEVQYFLERETNPKRQVIVIRGTDNLRNAGEDADYVESENPRLGIYVHRGFDQTAIQIYRALLPQLDKRLPVLLTGHSLGAAISTLLMMYLHEDGFTLGPSINFGQPKVTNKAGAAKYHFLPLLRVVDENDLVPLVPPDDLIDAIHGGYAHFGPELMLLEGEYYVYENAHQSRQGAVTSFWKNLADLSVSEHYMQKYLRNITSKLAHAIQVKYSQREEFIQ